MLGEKMGYLKAKSLSSRPGPWNMKILCHMNKNVIDSSGLLFSASHVWLTPSSVQRVTVQNSVQDDPGI